MSCFLPSRQSQPSLMPREAQRRVLALARNARCNLSPAPFHPFCLDLRTLFQSFHPTISIPRSPIFRNQVRGVKYQYHRAKINLFPDTARSLKKCLDTASIISNHGITIPSLLLAQIPSCPSYSQTILAKIIMPSLPSQTLSNHKISSH